MKLYVLDKISDDPRYEGFGLEDSPSVLGRNNLLDDINPTYGVEGQSVNRSPSSLKLKWKAPRVLGRVSSFNDYPCANLVYPAFSVRACEVMRDLLESNGELLPLNYSDGKYYMYHITRVVDGLDIKNCLCESWCDGDPPTDAADIIKFAFIEKKIDGLSIFRLSSLPMEVFVSEEFVSRALSHGLKGFDFKQIWPIQKNTNWKLFNKQTDQNRLKDNSLVIEFNLHGKKPDIDESKTLEMFESSADDLSKLSNIDDEYLGCYEGKEIAGKKYRLFFSTPDVNILFPAILRKLEAIEWAAGYRLVKRYGPMFDKRAKQEIVE